MTPFGRKMRVLRDRTGVNLNDLSAALGVSTPYLSALEHGRRGRPSRVRVHEICQFFNLGWDEADELQRLARISHPRITVDTSGLSPEATELANELANRIRKLPLEKVRVLLAALKEE
jgi:transcriptional regulator with XRE-family HTH domain